MKGFFFTK